MHGQIGDHLNCITVWGVKKINKKPFFKVSYELTSAKSNPIETPLNEVQI